MHMAMDTINSPGKQQRPGRRHFVLVHGLCHGAWCWYKVTTTLRRAGHTVTPLDMAGCGVHPARVDEVLTFEDYSRPLLDAMSALPPGERIVLVGHSHGGSSIALAAERFPDKVDTAVFVTAFLPTVGRSMAAATADEFLMFLAKNEPDYFLDTKVLEQENPEIPGNPIIWGPRFMEQRLYQLSPPEDLTLGLSLIRPGNGLSEDKLMRDKTLLTEEGYGAVRRVFVVVKDDLGIPVEFQRFMIAQSPGVEVEAMAAGGADHMAMLSRPRELADLLVRIANKCRD